jgi:hypothetical protein
MDQLLEYWALISPYVNPGRILWSGIWIAIASFTVVLVLMIIFRKKILVRRRYQVLRILAVCYFLILPLLAAYTGFKWGVVHKAHQEVDAQLPKLTGELDKAVNVLVDGYLLTLPFNTTLSIDEHIDALTELIFKAYESTVKISSFNDILKRLAVNSTTTSAFVKKSIHDMVEQKIGIEKDITKGVMKTRMDELLETGLFTKISLLYTDSFFGSIKKGTFVVFLLVLGIIVAEIGIAWQMRLSGKKDDQVPPEST